MSSSKNPTLAPEALYTKSQVYIRRGLKAQSSGDTEEYQLWASLALELLGKAALAKVHPALIADPQHYQSLFAACGRELSPEVRTITAKTLFERLRHIDKTFDVRHQTFSLQITVRRNAELHSGESPFSGMAPDTWEREFWGATQTLLEMQDETLESWLGAEDSKAPAMIIEQAEEALEWAIKNRITRCKEDFEQKYQDPNKRAQILLKSGELGFWELKDLARLVGDEHREHKCPACGATGRISGYLWHEEVSEDYDPEEPGIEWVDKVFTVEQFICPTCTLHLFGAAETRAAGLPSEFTTSEVRERDFGDPYMNE